MKRTVTVFLAMLLGLAALAAGFGWWGQQRAAALLQHPAYSTEPVPVIVAQHRRQLDSRLDQLLSWHPNLKAVPREYLEQPLEQTQELLFTLAQKALASREQERWRTLVEILNGIWLLERGRERPDAQQLATLVRYQQRLQALFAQARLFRASGALPEVDAWHTPEKLGQRYLLGCRQELWKQAHLQHPLQPLTWWRLQSDFQQLDRWHRQLQAAQAIEVTSSDALKATHLGLQLISGL